MTGVLFSKLFNDELHPLGAKREQLIEEFRRSLDAAFTMDQMGM